MSGKGVRRPASAFSLDDIDSMMASKKAKKEIGSSSVPKSTPPVTLGKSQTKKKKGTDSFDYSLLADVDPTDAHKLIQKGANILVRAYDEMTVENAEMIRQVTEMKRVNETNQLLLKEKLEDLNRSNKLLHEAKIQHAQELEDTIAQTKKSAALTVYQARIKMFEEASDPGFDKTKWDVDTWKKYVAELGGEDETETEKVGGSGLDKGVEDGGEGNKVVAVQDDDGNKDKA